MATLTETAYKTRKAINYGILALIAYIILRILWSLVTTVFLAVFPPKPLPPNHAFGKLPVLVFPTPAATSSSSLTFQLDTIEGTVPKASPSATVYFMPKNAPNLLALTKATDFARRMDFEKEPRQETKHLYVFSDATNPFRYLRYDIVSKNFLVRYMFEQEAGLFAERTVPLEQIAKSEAKNMLDTYDIFAKDIEEGTIGIKYLKRNGTTLAQTTSFSQAEALRLDFFRAPLGDMPVVTAPPDEGNISFIFSGSRNMKKRILQFSYVYWPVEYQTTATYSLKPSSSAWTELQSERGYIARYPAKGTVAVVRKVYLAYYDSREPQTYLQPVFVFEGDDGFLAYVPAVEQTWIEEK